MAKIKLTAAYVASLKPVAGKTIIIWDGPGTGREAHCAGLGIRVTSAGSKSYVAQGQCASRTVRVTLERADLISVEDARDQCRAALRLMRENINPVERKKAVKVEAVTLRAVMEDYIAKRRTKFGPLRDSTKKEIRKHCLKLEKWMDKPIASITHSMVATRFRELSEGAPATATAPKRKPAPVSANLVMITLQSLCNWARDSSIGADGVPTLLPFNPVTTSFKQTKWNVVTPRTKRVPTNKTGAVWHLLQGRMDPDKHPPSVNQNASLVLSLLLTGCRVNELATLQWSAVHFEDSNGAYIEFDTKTHRVLKVPLTVQLESLLRQQHARREPRLPWVFLGKTRRTHIKDTRATMAFVSDASGLHLSPHTLRRSYVQAGHTCKVQKHIVDLLSGHVSSDVTTTHYTETNDLRAYVEDAQRIADWMEGQGAIFAAQQAGANVVQLQTA